MSLLAAALLGVVQGLTEFLPVSSSAHLILGRAFFGWDAERSFGLAFDVACHVGTLAAVLLFFRQDIGEMLAALPRALTASPGPVERRIRLIAIGTLPIVVAAVACRPAPFHGKRAGRLRAAGRPDRRGGAPECDATPQRIKRRLP